MNAWLDAHEKTDLVRVDLDAKAREMKFEKMWFMWLTSSLDSRPLRKAAWYTLFTHAPELPRILVIVNCSIFISILIPHLVVKH